MPKKTSERVQLYLEPEQYQFLVREAKKEGSLAAVVRKLIDERLKGKRLEEDPIRRLSELAAEGGPEDLSEQHDRYIYGKATE
ncbi:MAG: hypothetical protein KGZ93_06265 [Actinobacteria bacterium]|nr:hypothetical protein [Actinomycetota bacterium]